MQYILKTWEEVREKLKDVAIQRAVIYNGYTEPLKIYFDNILNGYVVEIAF